MLHEDPSLGEQPWPRKGDDPFVLGEDWQNNACLNFMHDAPWYGYARGFKLLGDLGVKHVEQTSNDQDVLVYAILYGYRHYVELSLKTLIRDARRLVGQPGGAPEGHVLMDLWNTAKPLLLKIEPNSKRDLDVVGSVISKLDVLDRDGQTWRYPVDLGGDATLPDDLFHINLRQVREVIDRLAGFLDAADAHIGACLEFKRDADEEGRAVEAEFLAELRPDYGP